MSEMSEAVRQFGIAMDYDGTFTSCPQTWTAVCELLRKSNARVFCVTFRKPSTPVTDFPGEVFYTSGKPKAEYMSQQGVDVHIWIDDQPHLIGMDPLKAELRAAFNLPL